MFEAEATIRLKYHWILLDIIIIELVEFLKGQSSFAGQPIEFHL